VRQRFTGLWRHPDFLRLWGAQSVSIFGSQITGLALPLTAAVVLDASVFEMGLLTTAGTLPYLLVGLPAGAWVDRLRRRPILIAADLGRAALVGTIPLAAALDVLGIGLLYAIALLAGVLTVFFEVAYQSYLPSLISRDELVEGNSRLEMSNSAARVAGPGVAGLLVQMLSAPAALLADALSFLASAALIGSIDRTERAPADRGPRRGVLREIGEGLRAVLDHPLLRPIAFSTAVSNFCTGIVAAVFILFLTNTLRLDAGVIGLTYALGSLGAVGAAALAAASARRFGLGPSILIGKSLIALSALLVPLAGGPMVVAFGMLILYRVLGGAGAVISNVNQVSLRQSITPDQLQGRVNATNRFLTWATLPLGSLAGGALGHWIGIRPTLVVGAGGLALAVAWLFLSPLPGIREAPRQEGEIGRAT
jgi:MFS family permease